MGDGNVRLPDGKIVPYWKSPVADESNPSLRDEPWGVERGDWYSTETAEVVGVIPFHAKLMDNVTRDDYGRVIPLSERFGAKRDVRYSLVELPGYGQVPIVSLDEFLPKRIATNPKLLKDWLNKNLSGSYPMAEGGDASVDARHLTQGDEGYFRRNAIRGRVAAILPDLLKKFHANRKSQDDNYHTIEQRGNAKKQAQRRDARIWKQDIPVIVPVLNGDGSIKDIGGFSATVVVRETGSGKTAYDIVGIKDNPRLTNSLQNNREIVMRSQARRNALLKERQFRVDKSAPLVEVANSPADDSLNHPLQPSEGAVRITNAGTHDINISRQDGKANNGGRASEDGDRHSLGYSQTNPIVANGQVRADYQELLDNGRYTPEHVAEWEKAAVQWIRRVGGVENAVGLVADGMEPSGKVGTMVRRLVMESDTYAALPKETRQKVAMRHIMQGTEWGREGVARRVASLKLDSIRKVRAFIDAIRSRLTPEQRDRMREAVLRDTGIDLDRLPDDIHQNRGKLDRLITAALASKATTRDKLYEYWVNAILSAPMTHVANTVGNLANFAYELGVKRLAEAVVNHFAKRPDAARFSDFRAMWSAVDWKTVWRSAVQAFNIETLDGGGKYVEGAAPAIAGRKGRVIRMPGRFLRAADEFAKAVIVPAETAAMADRLGRQRGLEGAELDAFIREQLQNENSEAAAFGRRRSLELTFQEDPGAVVRMLTSLKTSDSKWAWPVKYMFPFVKTPYNLLRQGVRKSPLGTLGLLGEGYDILRGKRGVDSDFIGHAAEQVLAWGLVGMALAMGGGGDDEPPRLTGSSMGGGAGERMFRGRHVPAYSIRIGDKYYSYKRIEPLSTMLALIADGLESYRMAKTDAGASGAFRRMFTGTAHLIGEKSYLNTFSQIVQLFDEPERSIGSWATDFTASWMPNAVRQASAAFDDVRHDSSVRTSGVRWWRDQFHVTLSKAGVMRLAPKIDCFGRPITKDEAEKAGPGDILWRLLVPVNTKAADAMDPAERLIWNWNSRNPDVQYWPGVPSYRFKHGGVQYEMHGRDYADFAMESGRLAHRRILALVNGGRIKPSRPTESDIAQIKAILSGARRQVREKYVRQHRCDKAGNGI
jgi:hypothetical protein